MAMIPLGQFGNTVAEPTPAVDVGAVGRAVAGVGGAMQQAGAQVYERQMQLVRAKAANATLDHENAVTSLTDDIHQRVATGKLPYEQAPTEFNNLAAKIPVPKIAGADSATNLNMTRVVRENLFKGQRMVNATVIDARHVDQQQQLPKALDALATQSESASADIPALLQKAHAFIPVARDAGVSEAEIDARLQSFHAHVASAIARRDPQTALTTLSNPESGNALFDSLGFEARHAVREIAKGEIVKQQSSAIGQVYANQGADAGTHALVGLAKSGLDAELQDEVRAKVNRDVSQLRDQRRQEHSKDIETLETRIATDTAGASSLNQVHALYQAGAFTPSENAAYSARIESSIVDRNRNQAAAQAISDAIAHGLPLDPHNTEHRKFLSAAFQNQVGTLPVGSQPWQSTAIGLADRTRMLPEPAAAWTRQAVRSPDASLAAAASQFYGAVNTAAPDAASTFDEHTKAFAGQVNAMIEAGSSPDKAVETARNNVFDLKPELAQHREKQYTAGGVNSFAARSDNALNSLIAHDFGHWYSSNPVATAALSTDFNSQSQRYFVKTGDIGLAQKLAWDDLKRVYGESQVNGSKQIMAFPPERFGVHPEDVRADIESFLKSNPQGDGSTANEVMLVPDGLTMRNVGDSFSGQMLPPSYKLVTKSGDLVIDQHGVPKRYTLPSGDQLTQHFQAEQAKATAEAARIVQEARDSRDIRRNHEAFMRDNPQFQQQGF